jgi:hypothetical protein
VLEASPVLQLPYFQQALKINMPHDELEQLPLTRPLISYLSSRDSVPVYLSTIVPPLGTIIVSYTHVLLAFSTSNQNHRCPHYATDTNMCKFTTLKT